MFILPSRICDDIDKFFKKILWKVDNTRSSRYNVAWKDVCMMKREGGLGIKSLHVMNEALMAKHLWNVLTDKDSIWVRWVKCQWLKVDSV